jgi:hypothetical protein
MIRALIVAQLVAMLGFLGALVAASIYQAEVRESFRVTINDNLAKSLAAKVSLAEELIDSPTTSKYLASHQIEVVRDEIALYRRDPLAYVTSLTGGQALDQRRQIEDSASNPLKRAFLEKVIGWRSGVKARFDSSFAKIARDVCIFLGSNVAALLVALLLASRGTRFMKHALSTSVLLTAAVALSAFGYIYRNWLYRFLTNDFAVMAYPMSLVLIFGYLVFQYHAERRRVA